MSFFREAPIILALLLLPLVSAQFSRNGRNQQYYPSGGGSSSGRCVANGGVPGYCENLRRCPAAIGYIRSNVTLPNCGANDPELICCPSPNDRRISYKKCEEYKEVLKKSSAAIPLLPISFLEPETKEVVCDPNLNPLISGGRDAKIDEIPFMVALGYNSRQSPWACGGTLISPDFALTAAHCVTNQYAGKPTRVLLGDITLSKRTSNTREIVGVSRVIVHPSYKQPLTYHDIALIKFDRKVTISKSIMPACLPQAEDDLLRNIPKKKFTAAGFGITGIGGFGINFLCQHLQIPPILEPQSDTMQVVNLQGFNWTFCNEFYREITTRNIKFPNGIARSQICAGDSHGRKDTCRGDSGGGLVISDKNKRCIYYVVGITSFGPNQCGERIPAIYTNVLTYLDWIEDVVWKNNK